MHLITLIGSQSVEIKKETPIKHKLRQILVNIFTNDLLRKLEIDKRMTYLQGYVPTTVVGR